MPKHNLLLGHLLAVKPYIDALPADAHGFIPFGKMAREYPGGVFYLDMWPFIGPLMSPSRREGGFPCIDDHPSVILHTRDRVVEGDISFHLRRSFPACRHYPYVIVSQTPGSPNGYWRLSAIRFHATLASCDTP